jgi:alkylation response protein AidB-like acyl-CoA dehydrogenase
VSLAPVAAARLLADELLRPAAERVEVQGVPRSHLDALAAAGLFGVTAPREYGGSDQPTASIREIVEILAGADASTWFVWTQHHTPVRTLVRGTNDALRDRWLQRLAAGADLAGVAFTHLRRPGPPAVRAERVDGGWQIDGQLAWLTSWGLADVFLVGAVRGDDVVWLLVPLAAGPAVRATPLRLLAMGGTRTVTVELDGLHVADDDVVLVEPLAEWRVSDAERTADVSPAVLGVSGECVRRLALATSDPATAAAARLAAELAEVRRRAYQLQDTSGPREARLAARAQAHALSLRASAALVAAGAGRSMLADAPAGRLAREALFLLVQGQDAGTRSAQLAALSD